MGPVLTNELHQLGQNGPAMTAIAAITGSQVAHQQVTAAEYVQWKVTMVIVIGVKELSGLIAMNRDIGTVKIQHDFLRRCLVLFDEMLPQ